MPAAMPPLLPYVQKTHVAAVELLLARRTCFYAVFLFLIFPRAAQAESFNNVLILDICS